MRVYILCIEQTDREGESWYEPDAVFSNREDAVKAGDRMIANYYSPFQPDYCVLEFEVKD